MSKAKYGIKREGIFYVPMRDGLKLVTEVWLPADMPERSKVPAILVRTPYGRFKWGEPELRFVHRGYALIAQDNQGTGVFRRAMGAFYS